MDEYEYDVTLLSFRIRKQLHFLYYVCHVAHTDIRPANLIFIDGKLVLIDYDHAIHFPESSECVIKLEDIPQGDRRDLMLKVLPNLVGSWGETEEQIMLERSISASLGKLSGEKYFWGNTQCFSSSI